MVENKDVRDNDDDFIDNLIEIGVTSSFLARNLKRLLKAKRVVAKVPKGMTTFIYSKNLHALDIQIKAQELAHKLRGDFPSEKVEHTVTLEDKLRDIHNKRDDATN